MAMKVFDKCVTRYGHFMIYLSFNKKNANSDMKETRNKTSKVN